MNRANSAKPLKIPKNKSSSIFTRLLTLPCNAFDWNLTNNTTHMKNTLLKLKSRVANEDIAAIYTIALVDVTIVASIIAIIVTLI